PALPLSRHAQVCPLPGHCPCPCPGRAAACSALNQELREPGAAEKGPGAGDEQRVSTGGSGMGTEPGKGHHEGHGADPRSRRSLLRQLQALIKETSTKPAQTGTCVLILFLSLGLILLPSSSPFRRGGSRDGLGPTG
ncbi:CR3L4 protein, partial [Ploceus nigricollis]|nr:CR3L4 protein [Ploceus nigricollis]